MSAMVLIGHQKQNDVYGHGAADHGETGTAPARIFY
jgi:hypothetical protein